MVLTHADVVLTHADEVLTRADTVLTAADVVTTNANVVAANASADAVAVMYDAFHDTYLGAMADGATQGTNPTTNGTWAKNSSAITVVSASNIKVGQVVTGTGMPTSPKPNVISIDGTTVVISDNMAALGSAVALTFTGYGIYGTFNGPKDGPALNNDGDALTDGLLYFNTTDDVLKVYDLDDTLWRQTTPTSAQQTAIDAVYADASDIGVVAAKDAEIGRLGTAPMAASIALIGTDAYAHASTGDIKIVADNLAAVNNFADVYQIDDFSPSDPTTDGGGNALAKGDLAFDTTANVVKAYNGSAWIVATVSDVALLAGATFTGAVVFDNTVTFNSGIGGVKQTASQGLTGTITDSYFISLAYVLTGDVTLSGTNVLGKIADGTTNISITNDGSTRTLSGSGTLLFNSVMFN